MSVADFFILEWAVVPNTFKERPNASFSIHLWKTLVSCWLSWFDHSVVRMFLQLPFIVFIFVRTLRGFTVLFLHSFFQKICASFEVVLCIRFRLRESLRVVFFPYSVGPSKVPRFHDFFPSL